MRNRNLSLTLVIPLMCALLSSGIATSADFSGKTITALVGYSAGGPVDSFARLIAAHMDKHLPGKPTIVVQNKPGAGGVVAANFLYNVAKKDGSMFLVTIAPFTNQYIGGRNVKFDTPKFYWLGALNYSNTIYVRKELGIKSPADVMNARQQIVVGGLRPNSSRDLYMETFLEAVGYKKYKYVKGYRGTRPIRNAMLSGEVNFSTESAVAIATDLVPYIKEGTLVPLVQSGLTSGGKKFRDPRLPNIPLADEAILAVKGDGAQKSVEFRAMNLVISMFSLGRAIFAPPGTDPAVGQMLRMAVAKLNTDPDFQRIASKINGGAKMTLTEGASAQEFAQHVAGLTKSDPVALQFLEKMSKK